MSTDSELAWIDKGEAQQLGVLPLVEREQSILAADNIDIEHLRQYHRKCGYAAFVEKYYKYPGKTWGSFHDIFEPGSFCSNFRIRDLAWYMIGGRVNSADWVYNTMLERWPTASPSATVTDYLGVSKWVPYLDRPEVKRVLHMPEDITWQLCGNAVQGGDWTLDIPSRDGTLARVIEASEVVVMSSGADDYQIPFEGVRMAIQNLTWGGKTGFDSFVYDRWVGGADATLRVFGGVNNTLSGLAFPATRSGFWHEERGLRMVYMKRAGHGGVEDSPPTSNYIFDWLSDGIPELDFTFDYEFDPDYWGAQPEVQLDPMPGGEKPWGIWAP